MTIPWYVKEAKPIDQSSLTLAEQHQLQLTKPPGSLGRLEQIAIQFAAWQGTERPQLEQIMVRVFAGDHGICKQGVSAFPQQVTAQMIQNFVDGGAAISVLCKHIGAQLCVINMGTVTPTEDANDLLNAQLSAGTEDFSEQAAMSQSTMLAALEVGRNELLNSDAELFIGGEMGIGNTTSASAIFSAILGYDVELTVGPGTGLDKQGILHKGKIIAKALDLHDGNLNSPLDVLKCLGGLEIAGLVGAYIASAQRGIPILVDGFITTAAALIAVQINPSVKTWMLFAHRSAEPAHINTLQKLDVQPLLDLGLRLGEGSGAAVAVNLLQTAIVLHNNMATFTAAGVSNTL